MMMRRVVKRQHSGRKTGPCCPTSMHQLVLTTKPRHTASSLTGDSRASTHSEEKTFKHTQHVRSKLTPKSWVQMQMDFVSYCLCHQCILEWCIFICPVCIIFLLHKIIFLKLLFSSLRAFCLKIYSSLVTKDAGKHCWNNFQSLIPVLPSGGNITKYSRALISIQCFTWPDRSKQHCSDGWCGQIQNYSAQYFRSCWLKHCSSYISHYLGSSIVHWSWPVVHVLKPWRGCDWVSKQQLPSVRPMSRILAIWKFITFQTVKTFQRALIELIFLIPV